MISALNNPRRLIWHKEGNQIKHNRIKICSVISDGCCVDETISLLEEGKNTKRLVLEIRTFVALSIPFSLWTMKAGRNGSLTSRSSFLVFRRIFGSLFCIHTSTNKSKTETKLHPKLSLFKEDFLNLYIDIFKNLEFFTVYFGGVFCQNVSVFGGGTRMYFEVLRDGTSIE